MKTFKEFLFEQKVPSEMWKELISNKSMTRDDFCKLIDVTAANVVLDKRLQDKIHYWIHPKTGKFVPAKMETSTIGKSF